jgi:hypothetical protein
VRLEVTIPLVPPAAHILYASEIGDTEKMHERGLLPENRELNFEDKS